MNTIFGARTLIKREFQGRKQATRSVIYSYLELLTPAMSLGLNDLADATGSHTVFCCKFDFVPGTTTQVVQLERAFTGANEDILPFLSVVY